MFDVTGEREKVQRDPGSDNVTRADHFPDLTKCMILINE